MRVNNLPDFSSFAFFFTYADERMHFYLNDDAVTLFDLVFCLLTRYQEEKKDNDDHACQQ